MSPRWPNGETRSGVSPITPSQGGEPTRGTETSQYPEEEKSTERLLVAASERGRAETGLLVGPGLQDPRMVTATSAEVPWNGPPERVRAP